MDQARLFIAILLSFLLFFVWELFFVDKETLKQQSIAPSNPKIETVAPLVHDELIDKEQHRSEVALLSKKHRNITINTPLYSVRISEKGAVFTSFILKKYRKHIGLDSPLFEMVSTEPKAETITLELQNKNAHDFDLNNSFFLSKLPYDSLDIYETPEEVSFTFVSSSGIVIEKKFTFFPETYLIKLDISLKNQSNQTFQNSLIVSIQDKGPETKNMYGFEGPSALINDKLTQIKTKKIEESQQALTYLMEDVNESRAELDVLNKQLQAANKELEAFAYSVSHDLRAPLRNIDGFSQILLDKYSGILDKQGQHYLQRVRAGTQNMGQLIDDILSLSRSGRHHMDKKTINMESIVREVYKSLKNELKDRKVDFVVHECPPALADSHLIKIVFMNLLTNALKFTRIREHAKIETGFITENGHTVFFIKDNGAGFDMKYADKLFVAFQRLHRAEEYEGSGIGLAIVQRIIHRHGGRIWAESELNVGTTVYFTFSV